MPSITCERALTPDIIVRGRQPTRGQYDAALRILRDVLHNGGLVSGWYATTLDDDECAAWLACFEGGLLRGYEPAGAPTKPGHPMRQSEIAITDQGRLYVSQRSGGGR